MAYWIDFGNVRGYLSNYQGLSRQGRVNLFTELDMLLRHRADFFRSDPAFRTSPDLFTFDFTFSDPDNGSVHQFLFVVNDTGAAMGVLRIIYADGTRILP